MTPELSPPQQALRWSFWFLTLGALSWALLSPLPPEVGKAVLPPEMTFTASKSVHLGAYGFLTAFVAWLPANRRQRLACWLFLAGHAALTEYFQTFVPERFGCWQDVCINLAGMSLGLALVELARRRGWTTLPRPLAPPSPGPARPAPATSALRQ
jgi:VanZ family protein